VAAVVWIDSRPLWSPSFAPEKRREDGARKIVYGSIEMTVMDLGCTVRVSLPARRNHIRRCATPGDRADLNHHMIDCKSRSGKASWRHL